MLSRLRIVILGASGMLGHKLAQVLAPSAEVIAGVRGDSSRWAAALPVTDVASGVDVRNSGSLVRLLEDHKPDVVLNAAGVVKQILRDHDPLETVTTNAVYPNVLAAMCESRGIRLIHYSTDCVFTGAASGERGPGGYRETDQADSRDLYGMTKLAGEPTASTTLTLRTSMIGRELRGFRSLLEWFFAAGAGTVRGHRRALFSGLTTLELAGVTEIVVWDHPEMVGLWHVAADAVSKYDLLRIVKEVYELPTTIEPDDDFYCDRRLDGTRFRAATGWEAPPWRKLIETMRLDPFNYPANRMVQ